MNTLNSANCNLKTLIDDNRKFERIITTVPGVLYDYVLQPDGNGCFLYVSPQSSNILEIKNHELIKDISKFYDLIHPDDIDLFHATDRNANRTGKLFNLEFRIITPSNKIKWIYITSKPNQTLPGELTIWSGFLLDITNNKKLEEDLKVNKDNLEEMVKKRTKEINIANETLKINEEKYRELVENANSIILKFDKNGEIMFFNEFAEKFFGYKKNEIIGKNIIGTIMPKTETSGKNLQDLRDKIIKSPKKYSSNENENITKFGERVWVSWTNKGIYNYNGDLLGVQCIGMDSTLRKKMEKEKEQLIHELKRSNRDLESFAFITSHDLQEPLRTISSYAQLLERRYKGRLDNDADDFLDYMILASKRMKEMIKGLLDYSRINTEAELKIIDIELILKCCMLNLKNSIEKKGAIITFDNLPTLILNKEMITLVFQNLIGNAIKFSKPHTPPKIHISSSLTNSKEEYVFKVSDNGIGMEQQYTNNIFEVFKRLHPIGEYEGVGIGLSISRRIIEGYGGHIWVKSKLDKGSDFYFTLPKNF